MEDENEVLDWGNEDDEQQHQDLQRKGSSADLNAKRNIDDADDVEDSVSLGEDEDEQDRYGFQEEPTNSANDDENKTVSTPKSTNQDNGQQQQPHSSTDLRREDSSTTQLNSSSGSPHRNQGSTNQKSPQRSQSFTGTTRITHALPPKPIVTNVPFLHPSHPSIVEATAMSTRTTGRTGGKSSSSGPVDSDLPPLPPGWEVRHPRGSSREVYYYNIQTQESTWSRPVSSSTSTSRSGNTRRRRGSIMSAGDRSPSPPISNLSHPQELRSNRALPQGQPDISDIQKPSSDPNSGLSYKDRHYRPIGAEEDPASIEKSRRGDRNDVDPRFNLQNERSFTPPADPHRSRERSISPSPVITSNPLRGRDSRPSRGSRSNRGGRPSNTDSDIAMHRSRDPPADYGSSRGNWGPSSEVPHEFNGYQQPYRRPPRQQHQGADPPFEVPHFEERPNMRRNGSTRGRNRDHEGPQIVERRENRTQNMTASRTRSPQHDSDHEQAYQARREAEQPPTTLSISAPSSTHEAQPPRRRERPSRFDRPTPTTKPELSSLIASFSTPEAAAAAAAAAATSRAQLNDDIYVPDDILAPQDESHSHETAHAELTRPFNSQQVVSAEGFEHSRYPNKRPRADDRDYEKDRGPSSSELGRSSPSSEARPKRVPLPPQSMRFREVAGQPPQRGLHGSTLQTQHRPQPQLSPLLSSNVLPLGPRDQRATNPNSAINGPPSGPRYPPQNQGRDPEGSRSMGASHTNISSNDRERREERRLSGSAFPHSFTPSESVMDVDVDEHPSTSRITTSPSSRKPTDEAGIRNNSGMYADRDVDPAGDAPPRGPRAMAKPSISTSGSGYASHSTSPTTPFVYGPGGGNRPRDRSPPHTQGRMNDGNARREYEFDQYAPGQGRREPRPRPNDYTKTPSSAYSKVSGPNSVPIGSSRKTPVVLGAPPPGKTYIMNTGPPPGISTANMEPVRNMRVRGAPPPHKESYERPIYNEKPLVDYRPGRLENGAPRLRESSPGLMEPQSSPVNSNNAHFNHRGRRDGGFIDRGNHGRYNQAPAPDMGRALPRTWTPREPEPAPPRDLLRSHYDQHRATTPPILNEVPQTSLTWTPRDVVRQYEDLSIHQRDRGSLLKSDERPIQHHDDGPSLSRERYGEPDVRRSGSLERRLSEPYKEHYPETVRQPHALPPNPALHRGHNIVPPEKHWKDDRRESGPARPGWGEPRDNPLLGLVPASPSRTFGDPARGDFDMRGGRPFRIRRPQSVSQLSGDSSLRMDVDSLTPHLPQEYDPPQRPENLRRGGSLLDRLSLDQNDDTSVDSPPQSLRDRVQVPSKRDREEMVGDRHGHMMDTSFEDEGYDPNKKARRRNGKVRKVRRGGPP